MYMHDCRCTWEASNSNDISSFDRAMDFLKVLFCFSERRGEERERLQNHTDTHYTYIQVQCHVHVHVLLLYTYLASAMT